MFDVTVDGKLDDTRPSLLAKLLSSGSAPEPGHSSGSEGEKEFAAPEWDVPLSKNSLRKTAPTAASGHVAAPPGKAYAVLLLWCRSGPPADLPPDTKRRPFPEEVGHRRHLFPAAHLPDLAVPRVLQQRPQL